MFPLTRSIETHGKSMDSAAEVYRYTGLAQNVSYY